MRNKLKRSNKKWKDASCPSRGQPRTGEVITVSSSDGEDTDSAGPAWTIVVAAKNNNGPNVAAAADRELKPHQEQRKSICAKDIKIAPIFLRRAQHGKSKRSSGDGRLQRSVHPPRSEDVQQVKSQQQQFPAVSHLRERCRGQLSASALSSWLEEIQSSNPAFPVRAVFSTLKKKTGLQDPNVSLNPTSPQNHLKEKRKRGNESPESVPKRLRSCLVTGSAAGTETHHCHTSAQGVQERAAQAAAKQPRGNRLSRTHRLREQRGSPAGLVNKCEPYREVINGQSLKTSVILQRDSSSEDVLWTDKYSPQHSSEVIGNAASVNKLQSWLKKWKLRADCDERRKMEERKREENSNDSWDCGDFQGEAGAEDDREELLCNAVLITGPPGVGKTAAVYACSQELGFKVFEVNCSSQRSGCHVLAQLKEATQSHLVEMPGKDPLKPAYFNNYSSTPKSESLTGKMAKMATNVTSSSKKRAAQNLGRPGRKGKANPAVVTLASYFKMKAKADHLRFGGPSPSEKPDSETSGGPSPGPDQTAPQNKKTATSLILFEEVDVIFDDDVGFLAAIKTFMKTTKRPVVLTTNDPSFRERFNCSLEEIIFKTPSMVKVSSYLQLVALAESARLETDDVSGLLRLSGGDVRRCLLQLQLWAHSGGGREFRSGDLTKEPTGAQHVSVAERRDSADSQLPQCDTSCTASMLGLHSVTLNQLQQLLRCRLWSEVDMIKILGLLAESWRGGVPLLYSNLEPLLPLGATGTSVHFLHSELARPDLHIRQLDGNERPQASAIDSKPVRSISRLSRRKCVATFDTTSSSCLAQSSQRTTLSSRTAHSRDKNEPNAAKVASDCLDALSDFFDLMSRLDATTPRVPASRRPERFVWTGAEVKDGLLDETSEEEEEEESRGRSQEMLLDIQAAVEGLGCHRCLWQVSDAWTEAQRRAQEPGDDKTWERLVGSLTLPASLKRESLSFSLEPLCAQSVSRRRYELSRAVLGSSHFSLLGNRRAVCVDYMPVLRHICRFQRAQRRKEEPVRCPYFSSLHLDLSKSTIQLLAEDFS